MDSVPPLSTESSTNKDLDLKNKKETKIQIFLDSVNENLYNLEFSINENGIEIKCNNTQNGKDTIYYYNLTLDEIKSYTPYNSLSECYNYLKTLNDNNCEIEEKENLISLTLILDNHQQMNLDLFDQNDSLKMINYLLIIIWKAI